MLTQLETRVLQVIESFFLKHGHSPTIAEIASELGISSRGTVHRYVHSLIDKGHLVRVGKGWRGLQLNKPILNKPIKLNKTIKESDDTESDDTSKPDQSSEFSEFSEPRKPGEPDQFRIPLLGQIAAGLPIEAISNEEHLDLAGFFIGPDRYALRVTGDSMMDAGILDGDTVIVRKQSTAKTGDIVVALIDSHEATLKRLGRYGNDSIELIPENSAMAPMLYSAARIALQGIVVGQMRSY